jgi:hypothetical protein
MTLATLETALHEDGAVYLWHRRCLALAELEQEIAPERAAAGNSLAHAQPTRPGWRGGRVDPHEFTDFEDEVGA